MDLTPLKTTFSELISFLIRAQQVAPSCHPEWGNMEKLGEHGEVRERGEHEKDGKHQPDDLKYSIYDSKNSICDSKYSFWQLDDSKNLKMVELQAKCKALFLISRYLNRFHCTI